ncbi:MAG: muconolactone Delta-isomerase family protein [Dehalococcoidia bacterium]|nr:muconolactone Delta-isomerase family protein [Dehalococcoidia bacterium]
MKFLSFCAMKDVAATSPKSPMRQMLRATLDWIGEQKKIGKVLEAYAIPGGRAVIIWELPDADDAAQTIASIPIGAFMDFEVYALADINATMKAYIENIKEANQ